MSRKTKVFLTGGDGVGWALDEDLKLTRQALQDHVAFTSLSDCEVVHSVWWEGLLRLPNHQLVGKRIICHIPAEPYRYMTLPQHRHVMPLVGRWVVRSTQARRELAEVGVESFLIPYTVDLGVFRPLDDNAPELRALRERLGIPEEVYLIGNFHRDTEGGDLRRPKLVKGPDIFVEIVHVLHKRGYPIHVLLAGPRRHWMRRKLAELGVPYTFMGQPVEYDDLKINLLPRETLNLLYNLLDLSVVSSRSEGGPQAIMEAAAARRKMLSTRVGLAEDILEASCIYDTPTEAVERIARDIEQDILAAMLDAQYEQVQARHTPKAVALLFQQLYETIHTIPLYSGQRRRAISLPGESKRPSLFFRIMNRIRPLPAGSGLVVGLWHKFFRPPYGGGNQFMMALRKALLAQGARIVENRLTPAIDSYILNSIHFDVDRFLKFGQRHRLNVVHRVDGPIFLIRGFDREKDDLCFELNQRFASATVLQSTWSYQRIVEMGYDPVNPVIIHNAVDPDVFHSRGRVPFDPDRKIRLISTSWSNNPRKGGPIYKWIEEHLDWDRFEYTFVGRASEEFERIRQIDAVPSEQLADLLRQHDIYITASQNDPCSNALIEALSCGLPALYYNDGGHPELVGYGGLPFNDTDEILPQLDALVESYTMFQNLISVPTLDEVAQKYLTLLKEVSSAD